MAGFSWVLVRKAAADGLGAGNELAVKPPTPRPSLPRWSLGHQAKEAGVIVTGEAPTCCPAQRQLHCPEAQLSRPPGLKHPDLAMLLPCHAPPVKCLM